MLPSDAAEPGAFRSERTPYISPISLEVHRGTYKRVVAIMGGQMGKTDGIVLNSMGSRLHDDAVPILYIAPTRNFVESTFEPRLRAMLAGTPVLFAGLQRGKKEKKTLKIIHGVKVRLGWAGSAVELAGEPAAKVYIDERDRMDDDVGGEGDPVELGDGRHATFPDGQTIVCSTPTFGMVEAKEHPVTGIHHWEISDQVQSQTWKLWQEGTRHEWAWPCPHCGDYFVPRFSLLWWPEKATPETALREAKLRCAHCSALIDEEHKEAMNARGVYVAPGQRISKDGSVSGDPPFSQTVSFWVSGLCSPWVTWGQRAYSFLEAARSGDPERVQASINVGLGELYSVGGEAPKESALRALMLPYKQKQHVAGVERVLLSVDVQKESLYYVVRGWGKDLESWLLEEGQIIGSTENENEGAWKDLASIRDRFFCGQAIVRAMIDSGYRTSTVYSFCRKFPGWALPTKGRETMDRPLSKSDVDTTPSGSKMRGGLSVWSVNTDYFKRWLLERFARDPELPGGFHLPEDVSDAYLKQLTAEARVVKPSGAAVWVRLRRENHFLDCEALNVAAAHSLHLQLVTSEPPPPPPAPKGSGGDDSGGADPFGGGGDYGGFLDSTRR